MIFFYSSSATSPWYVPVLCVLLPLVLQSGYGGFLGPLGVLLGPASVRCFPGSPQYDLHWLELCYPPFLDVEETLQGSRADLKKTRAQYTNWSRNSRHNDAQQPPGFSSLAQLACLATAVVASFFICKFFIGLNREVQRSGLRRTVSALRTRPVRQWLTYLDSSSSGGAARPRRGTKPQSHQARFEAVSKRVQQLPTELYLSKPDLEQLPLHSLKATLTERGVKLLPGEGLDRQEAIRMALESGGSSSVSCGVCCEDYDSQDVLRKLPKCGHRFHLECIDRWLLSMTDYSRRPCSCPICNTEI